MLLGGQSTHGMPGCTVPYQGSVFGNLDELRLSERDVFRSGKVFGVLNLLEEEDDELVWCTMPMMWLGKCVRVVILVNIMIHS